MKITIERNVLLERLSQVAKAADTKNNIPILGGILFQSNGELSLTGSDTVFSITTTLDDYLEHEAGEVVIPAKKILEIIKKMPNTEITIDADNTLAKIECGKKTVTLSTLDAEEYPIKKSQLKEPITVDGNKFCNWVDGTTFAVSTNEATPVLCGMNVTILSESIKAVATDRHRLAGNVIEMDVDIQEKSQYIVPTKILEEVSKTKPSKVEIWFSNEKIDIKAGEFKYSSSLHDGSYPDTSKIIPSSANITVNVDTETFLKSLELAEKVNEDKTKIVLLDVSQSQVIVSAKDNAAGMEDILEAEVDGDDIKVSANAVYLIDALKHINTKKVVVWITGAMSPIILKPENDDTSVYLVLPYRVQS